MPNAWRFRIARGRRSAHAAPRRGRALKRGATVVALVLAFILVLGGTAFAQFEAPGVTITPGGENCNGIIPTPGSENTVKTLVGGTLVPGGTAQYQISYPVDASHLGDEWEIVDCVLLGSGTDLKTYDVLDQATFSGVINSTSFLLNFTFHIPADAALGERICNVAKTTEGPSAAQASNRKAGPACFIVGGDARVQKHSTTDPNGPVIPGATFLINNCVNTSLTPALQPLLVEGIAILPGPGTLTIANSDGIISFTGAVGSHCDVTETVAPAGYGLPDDVTQTVTIAGGTTPVVVKFLDPPAPGSLLISKVAPAGSTQVFTFNIVCTNPSSSFSRNITGTGTSTISGIAAGSQCTVTEVVPAGYNPPVYSPGQTVTILSAQTVTITVTNTIALGSLTINKVAPAGSTDTFTFNVDCGGGNTYQLQVVGSGSATQTGIPALSVCTITEVVPAGYAQPLFSPSNVLTIVGNQTVSTTVTNTLLPGSLTINKVAPAEAQDEEFVFDVICTLGGAQSVFGAVITGSDSSTINNIPAGSTCTVTEISIPAGFGPPSYSPPGGIVLVPGGAVAASQVTVTNTLLPLDILVVKTASTVGGAPGDPVTYTYEVTNTGEVDLIDVVVVDDILGDVCTLDTLAVDETKTCTKSSTLPNAAGLLTNVATATGSDRFGRSTSDTDDATVSVVLPVRRTRPLPATGTDVTALAWAGLALLLLGSLMLRTGKRGAPLTAAAGTTPRFGESTKVGRYGHVDRRWHWFGRRAGPKKRSSST